jgi:hypothetical protein
MARHFKLHVQPGHPDGCGGFQGVGTLCLLSGLILTVPGLWLGFWLAAAPRLGYGTTYLVQHSALLLLTLVLACAAFGVPLIWMHRAMVRDTKELRSKLRIQEEALARSARDLLLQGNSLRAEDLEQRVETLNAKGDFYARHRRIPTWPIRASTSRLFVALQFVPTSALVERIVPALSTPPAS